MPNIDPNKHDSLERFVLAQNTCFEEVIKELGSGRKTSHWIWYVFPQIVGLGFSEYSTYYGIKDLKEAKAYWANPLLKDRYEEVLKLVLQANKTAEAVLGQTDANKLQSSITLFLEADPNSALLNEALEQLYFGKPDLRTLELLNSRRSP
ncbi:DUF1810 domain-containing protein [Polynucleobacter sp.]|jgi:uncharacterized protein (DUF1810 family)|uniref:DUF1810 domain-containing protein n=1 Tax=Polynucleobacter sp. TaxID=2029855 RepID=UPI0027368892|nr:DUF1810 family protein [Polynucleobacter sp.]MDP3122392.1 DUF1810 family protein [Polynucleobacter sp.]